MVRVVISANSKGGTGKTLVAINLAFALSKHGKTGLIDADIDSANVYEYLGMRDKIGLNGDRKMLPMEHDGIKVFSMGGFVPDSDKGISLYASSWQQMIHDAVYNVKWGELHYLIIDAPAGTSREKFVALKEAVEDSLIGIVVTTQPNIISDVRRLYDLCARHRIRILGLIENMRGIRCPEGHELMCPECGQDTHKIDPFGDGAQELCRELGLEYFGAIPLSRRIRQQPILPTWAMTPIGKAVEKIISTEPKKKTMAQRIRKIINAVRGL